MGVTDAIDLIDFQFPGGMPPTASGPPPAPCGTDPDPPGSAYDLGFGSSRGCLTEVALPVAGLAAPRRYFFGMRMRDPSRRVS